MATTMRTIARLRWAEARKLLELFETSCGPPSPDGLLMSIYFNCFLFELVSIEELVSCQAKEALRRSDLFMFLKALRNVGAHEMVLDLARAGKGKKRLPTTVLGIETGVSDGRVKLSWQRSEHLLLPIARLRKVMDRRSRQWRKQRKCKDPPRDVTGARHLLRRLVRLKSQNVDVMSAFRKGLNTVASVIGEKPEDYSKRSCHCDQYEKL
jgi:hypothetical protein